MSARVVALLQVPVAQWDTEAQTFIFPTTLNVQVCEQGDGIILLATNNREEPAELDDFLADLVFEALSEPG